MILNFTKMHGTGNDYVYINLFEENVDNPAEVAEYLNLSIDTVYVYKARLKARSVVDKEEFESRIMAIPKP